MNYADHSEVMAHLRSLKRHGGYGNPFDSMRVNSSFEITFYAGKPYFCFPLEEYDCLLDYKTIQISIDEINDATPIDEMTDIPPYIEAGAIYPQRDNRFSIFDWSKYFVHINSKGHELPSYIGHYVPIDIVPKIVHDVYRVSCLKAFY